MSNVSLSTLDAAAGASHRPVPARSYYNLVRPHRPTAAPPHLPEVSVNSASHGASAALLSRPPSTLPSRTLLEPADDVHAPVPLRTTTAWHVLPLLSSHRGSFRAEGSSNINSNNNNTPAPPVPSPDSVFRPISMNLTTYAPLEPQAPSAAPAGRVVVVGEETVRPLLCPPTRAKRATAVLGAAARTNPFAPEGVEVRHLPSYTPRVLNALRPHGRLHATAASFSATHTPAADNAAAALWDEAASEADVLAFFSPVIATSSAGEWAASVVEPGTRHTSKAVPWHAAATPQSSICELSTSEDMFLEGTASSDGSAWSSGAHRNTVIDADAIAGFQRDGARRQREVFALATTTACNIH